MAQVRYEGDKGLADVADECIRGLLAETVNVRADRTALVERKIPLGVQGTDSVGEDSAKESDVGEELYRVVHLPTRPKMHEEDGMSYQWCSVAKLRGEWAEGWKLRREWPKGRGGTQRRGPGWSS